MNAEVSRRDLPDAQSSDGDGDELEVRVHDEIIGLL